MTELSNEPSAQAAAESFPEAEECIEGLPSVRELDDELGKNPLRITGPPARLVAALTKTKLNDPVRMQQLVTRLGRVLCGAVSPDLTRDQPILAQAGATALLRRVSVALSQFRSSNAELGDCVTELLQSRKVPRSVGLARKERQKLGRSLKTERVDQLRNCAQLMFGAAEVNDLYLVSKMSDVVLTVYDLGAAANRTIAKGLAFRSRDYDTAFDTSDGERDRDLEQLKSLGENKDSIRPLGPKYDANSTPIGDVWAPDVGRRMARNKYFYSRTLLLGSKGCIEEPHKLADQGSLPKISMTRLLGVIPAEILAAYVAPVTSLTTRESVMVGLLEVLGFSPTLGKLNTSSTSGLEALKIEYPGALDDSSRQEIDVGNIGSRGAWDTPDTLRYSTRNFSIDLMAAISPYLSPYGRKGDILCSISRHEDGNISFSLEGEIGEIRRRETHSSSSE